MLFMKAMHMSRELAMALMHCPSTAAVQGKDGGGIRSTQAGQSRERTHSSLLDRMRG